eukprot:CAMPEP_0167774220 /NCGR_PEP_ID=MMETSP0111_2-20121227/1874_1 /TAXON_ID=91324 /ORGANISM="Lotharella globosa, Strain CCCM811" /LENGTH=65 /DNA_ID=CAMNT_0007663983 /DNA_START=411 /DNA_END=609 /DNA_ORIENTATION=-
MERAAPSFRIKLPALVRLQENPSLGPVFRKLQLGKGHGADGRERRQAEHAGAGHPASQGHDGGGG